MKRKMKREHDRIRKKLTKPSAAPVDISDEEVKDMQEKTEQRVWEIIVARLERFFGDDFEKREEEVRKRTAILRKNGATLVMIDGQPALEIKPPLWVPSAQGVECKIDFNEYEVNGATQYLNN
ncbi:hypothetical protein [Vibrio phage CKB-S2]|nr:hypothetical protein [Vibrio phage CKB-S2]